MIRSTFALLEGIGAATEQRFWEQGITSWGDFLSASRISGISPRRKGYYDRKLIEARRNLYSLNASYFCKVLPRSEHWRLYQFFRDEAVFIDIEVSGVRDGSDATVIGMFDGLDTRIMVKGINLDFRALAQELRKYKLLVTFNGSVFDMPFIRKHYPLPELPHFDLRFACSRLGLGGGLKEIENRLGILRKNELVAKLAGGDPYTLWRMFRATGDDYYLNLLLEYNEEDCINLRTIADIAYDRMKAQCTMVNRAQARSATAAYPAASPS